MFGGKTEELIRILRRAIYAKQKVIAFKHASDGRYDPIQLASHGGDRLMAHPVHSVAQMRELITDDTEIVGIDEGQFLGADLVDFARWLRMSGRRVTIVVLNQTYAGDPFPGPGRDLLSIADSIAVLTAVCTVCGETATFSQKLTAGTDIVEVGETETYAARCILHWNPEGSPVK